MTAGEMLGLIGPNGAGKTTVFNLLSGFLAPDAGDVRFRGASLVGLKPHAICRRGLARTFQIVRPVPAPLRARQRARRRARPASRRARPPTRARAP